MILCRLGPLLNEVEKKRYFGERVIVVGNGSFTLLVFATNGGMGRECIHFYQRLSEMIAEKKRNVSVLKTTNFIRTKISFSLLRSTLLCLRGSRSLRKEHSINDIELSNSI